MLLGLVLFNILINDLRERKVNRLLVKFAENTKIGGVVNNKEDRSQMQSDLDHFLN